MFFAYPISRSKVLSKTNKEKFIEKFGEDIEPYLVSFATKDWLESKYNNSTSKNIDDYKICEISNGICKKEPITNLFDFMIKNN